MTSKVAPIEVDAEYLCDTLAELLSIASPTGFTDAAAAWVEKELERLGLSVERTRRGAIRARLPGRRAADARAVVSHLDTLGAQVRALKDNGRLELVPVGTWSARFAEGARTTIFTRKASYRGAILPLRASGHTFGDDVDTLPVGWDHVELRVDAQSVSKDALEALGIEVGDIVAVDPQPEFVNGYVVSRHLDNKGGVALMLAALRALAGGPPPPVDIWWLFTVAEEVGYGAAAILTPEIAQLVAVDNGTTAPGQNSREFGVTFCMADMDGPFDRDLTRALVDLCEAEGIGYQKDVFRHYRSDSASALVSGADIRTALATFGVDASHGYERIHVDALVSVARLLVAYALSPAEQAPD